MGKKNDVNKQINRIFEDLDKSVNYIVEKGKYEATASAISGRILKDLTKRSPKYNDYSGNLTRSFFVFMRLGGEEYLYICDPDVAKQPAGNIAPKQTFAAYVPNGVFKPKNGIYGRAVRKYKLQKKRHSKTKGGKYVSMYRENRGRPRENEGIKMHQYIDEIPRPFRSMIGGVAGYNDIAVGNYTPYRRLVEAKGYRVMGGGYKRNWLTFIKEEYGMRLNISMKQLAWVFKKGRKYMPTTKSGAALFDQLQQPAGYARAKQNAKLSYKHRLY